ncbi:hypothetical protein BASA60_003082 [Batrachochytrium salamandrivorans]|nr:hypothetical protein BASA60_003082 [Batrachochytrium salamandrivorans]
MQFFHLFSFVVVASYAAALPQPAGLSEKYSNNVDTTLASGLEARSYQPGLNSQRDSATLTLLKRQDDSEESSGENSKSDPFPSSTSGPNKTVGSDFTKDEIKAAQKISGDAGNLVGKYFRRNAYVNVALRRWSYESVPKILHSIESGLGENEYSKIKSELLGNLDRLKAEFKEELGAIVDNATKILNNDGSDIENVEKISKSFKRALSNRLELLEALKVQLQKFNEGATLGEQLANVTANVNKFLEEQFESHEEMMQALRAASSQYDPPNPLKLRMN